MTVTLDPDYRPTEDEEFMNPRMREHFRQKLLKWKTELLRESDQTLEHMQKESLAEADIGDRATLEYDSSTALISTARYHHLITLIHTHLVPNTSIRS